MAKELFEELRSVGQPCRVMQFLAKYGIVARAVFARDAAGGCACYLFSLLSVTSALNYAMGFSCDVRGKMTFRVDGRSSLGLAPGLCRRIIAARITLFAGAVANNPLDFRAVRNLGKHNLVQVTPGSVVTNISQK
jgi:hypothetical protein